MQKKLQKWTSKALLIAGALCLSAYHLSAATDYAIQMKKAATSLLLDIATAGDRLVEVGERGHILYSDNKGQSWVQARVPTSVMLTRVFFVTPTMGWAAGHDGNVLFTQDGAVTWELQRNGVTDQARINEERVSRAKQHVATLQARLPLSSTEEREKLLQQLEDANHELDVARDILHEPVYAPPLMDIWFANENQGWAAGAFGNLLRTSNGGRVWDDWSFKVQNPEELHFNGVAADSTGTVYLASEWGYMFRSTNGGESWEAVETGYDGSFFGVVVNPVTDSVFAYGLRGTIYRSKDHGGSWEELPSHTRSSLFGAAGAANGSLVFVGLNGAAVLTRDDGDNFVPLDQDTRRGLFGVTALGNGQFIVTGDGGSARLANMPEVGR